MIKKNTQKEIILYLMTILLLYSCTTFNHKDPYPNMEVLYYKNSHAYFFKNDTSDKLVIHIDGSGWDSVLGIKNEKKWLSTHLGAQMLQVLGEKYNFLIPEKLNREPGLVYFEDIEDRANYTAENLLNCYVESINGFLAEHTFTSVILIGISEGGILLPFIYEKMISSSIVTSMVIYGCGGLSLYESYKILSTSPNVSDTLKEVYLHIIEVYDYIEKYKLENKIVDITVEENFYGFNYRWFDSFMNIRPMERYKNINLPILFLHGEKDINIPVESTRYIYDNMPDKPFEYIYYNWAHEPENYFDIIKLRLDIASWITKIDFNK
jgi:esterase/lipase